MNFAPTSRTTIVIDLELIDPPALDARVDRDEKQMEDLARDLMHRGQLFPIFVFEKGVRFEAVDGWSRCLALRSIGRTQVEAFVYPSYALALEGVKYAANAFKVDLTPADEAKQFYELFTGECGEDIEKVCAIVNKSRDYVSRRINLALGDDLVFAALRDKKIRVGVAEILNRIDKDDFRRHYLHHAIESGATVAIVTGWLAEYEKSFKYMPESQEPQEPAPATFTGTPKFDPHRCEVCGVSDRRIPQVISVHASCREAILDPMLRAYRGEQ